MADDGVGGALVVVMVVERFRIKAVPNAQLGIGLGDAGRGGRCGVCCGDLEHGRDGPLRRLRENHK